MDEEDAAKVGDQLITPDGRELCTRELRTFLKTHFEIFDFFFFGIHLATSIDKNRMIAAKALASVGGSEKDKKWLKDLEDNPNPVFNKLADFGILQSENICIRTVDNFLSYLSEIVQVGLQKRPEILRSSESVRLDDILRFKNYRDLVGFLVNRKVNELSYKSIRDFEQFLVERTSLSLTQSDAQKADLMFAIELRNIYTHSRGIVTETTAKRLSKFEHGRTVAIGKRLGADFDEIVRIANSLVAIARDLDSRFASKFRIQRRRYEPLPSRGNAKTSTAKSVGMSEGAKA